MWTLKSILSLTNSPEVRWVGSLQFLPTYYLGSFWHGYFILVLSIKRGERGLYKPEMSFHKISLLLIFLAFWRINHLASYFLQIITKIKIKSFGHDWATSLSLFTFLHWRRNGNPLQWSCLENPRDGGAWWAAVYGVAQSRTRLKRLSSSSSSCRTPFLLLAL